MAASVLCGDPVGWVLVALRIGGSAGCTRGMKINKITGSCRAKGNGLQKQAAIPPKTGCHPEEGTLSDSKTLSDSTPSPPQNSPSRISYSRWGCPQEVFDGEPGGARKKRQKRRPRNRWVGFTPLPVGGVCFRLVCDLPSPPLPPPPHTRLHPLPTPTPTTNRT